MAAPAARLGPRLGLLAALTMLISACGGGDASSFQPAASLGLVTASHSSATQASVPATASEAGLPLQWASSLSIEMPAAEGAGVDATPVGTIETPAAAEPAPAPWASAAPEAQATPVLTAATELAPAPAPEAVAAPVPVWSTPAPTPAPAPVAGNGSCGAGLTPGEHLSRISVDGRMRSFRYVVPQAYVAGTALPLIFLWHGSEGQAGNMTWIGLDRAAEAAGAQTFVISFDGEPQPQWGNVTGWDIFSPNSPDLRAFDVALAWAQQTLCVDSSRVFTAGFSWGAEMAHALACWRGDKLRGVQAWSGTGSFNNCGALPAMRATYSANNTDAYSDADLMATTRVYQKAQQCSETTSVDADGCVRYSGCNREVTYCPVPGLSHYVPDNAASETWAFFARQ